VEVAIEFLRVVLRKRRKQNDVERLKAVSSMRGDDG
jgi:hypothetical protein